MKRGLKCPLCLGAGSGAAVVAGDGAGVGMVVVVLGGAVLTGSVVVVRRGAVVAAPAVVLVLDDVELLGGRVVEVVDEVGIVTWADAGHVAQAARRTNRTVRTRRTSAVSQAVPRCGSYRPVRIREG